MKIKDGFMLSRVAGSYVVVPVGAVQADFTGMITLNPVGAFLWSNLEKETTREELLKNVLAQYSIDEETAIRRTNQNPLHIAATPVSTVLPII